MNVLLPLAPMPIPPPTYYQQLGLDPQASLDEIKAAYRKCARQVHPDRLPAETPEYLRQLAQREFLQLQRAYRVLSDSQQRQAYDLSLKSKSLPPPTRMTPPVVVVPVPEPIPPIPSWPTLLSAGLAGAALCLMGLALWNSLSPAQSLEMANKTSVVDAVHLSAATDPVGIPVSEEAILNSSAVGAEESVQEATSSQATTTQSDTPFQPSAEQINRFARALVEVQPLLQATQNRLEQANSSEERQQIEQQFENAASKVIAANQLTPEEYHRISASAQSDPQVAASVTAAARRWIP
ncbi:MAG: DnaJ domain-containing protein [Thermostichus sp. DG02_5_bins_236]